MVSACCVWLFGDMVPAISISNPTSFVSKFVNVISFPVICCRNTSPVAAEEPSYRCWFTTVLFAGPTDSWSYDGLHDWKSDASSIVSISWVLLLLDAKELNLGLLSLF